MQVTNPLGPSLVMKTACLVYGVWQHVCPTRVRPWETVS